jgi:FMN phosphatase YigB (HAD superfamily)
MFFFIDFDHTIFAGHTHNTLCMLIRAYPWLEKDHDRQWQVIQDIPLIGSATKWHDAICTLINRGDKVSIVSFSSFPHIIARSLSHKLKLPADIIAQITIVGFLPADPSTANKNDHIAQALQKMGVTAQQAHDQKQNIILVDDAVNNCSAAIAAGYKAIVAKENGEHIEKMLCEFL